MRRWLSILLIGSNGFKIGNVSEGLLRALHSCGLEVNALAQLDA